MNKIERISMLAIIVNKTKLGGVKQAFSDSSCDVINPFTYTCGRLFCTIDAESRLCCIHE